MRTLHVGLRVRDLERSLAFYSAVGYTVLGTVEGTASGSLSMLQLPGDSFVAIELVHDPARAEDGIGTGINHLVIQVESLDAALADLAAKGITPERPDGAGGPRTRWITDPDGYRIELVQWPPGHGQPVTLLASSRTAARLGQAGRIRLRGAVTADVPVAVMPTPAGTAVVTDDPARVPAASGLIFVTKGHQLEEAAEAVRAVRPRSEDTVS